MRTVALDALRAMLGPVELSDIPTLADLLRTVPLFRGLPQETTTCLTVLRLGREVRPRAGEIVARQGAEPQFYVVLQGGLRLMTELHGREMPVGVCQPGGYIGEVPLLAQEAWPASAQAVVDTRLYGLEREAFLQMLATCPGVAYRMLCSLAQRVRREGGT